MTTFIALPFLSCLDDGQVDEPELAKFFVEFLGLEYKDTQTIIKKVHYSLTMASEALLKRVYLINGFLLIV